VSSQWYRLANVNVDELNPIDHPFPGYLYYVSKGMEIMFTLELAKRLEGTGVTANCLHPGVIDTGIWRNVRFPLSLGLSVMKLFFKTQPEGAQTTIYVSVNDELKDISGKYFLDCKEARLQNYILNEEKGKKLWEESVKMVQLQPSDPKI
jgi:NAD(P)-dependent dehydrogenase (short-subunit alcohol dehydrogenase family)